MSIAIFTLFSSCSAQLFVNCKKSQTFPLEETCNFLVLRKNSCQEFVKISQEKELSFHLSSTLNIPNILAIVYYKERFILLINKIQCSNHSKTKRSLLLSFFLLVDIFQNRSMSFFVLGNGSYAEKAEPNDKWIFSLALFLFYLSFAVLYVHIEHEDVLSQQYIDGEKIVLRLWTGAACKVSLTPRPSFPKTRHEGD